LLVPLYLWIDQGGKCTSKRRAPHPITRDPCHGPRESLEPQQKGPQPWWERTEASSSVVSCAIAVPEDKRLEVLRAGSGVCLSALDGGASTERVTHFVYVSIGVRSHRSCVPSGLTQLKQGCGKLFLDAGRCVSLGGISDAYWCH
jgi:hypothetical protein